MTSLNNLIEWGRRNSMTFNAKKCKIMHCGRNNPKAKYNMNGVELAEVNNEKDIGITVSSNLKPSKHCEEAANRARAVLGQISRCFHYRDRKVFLRLYIQYVRPHLEFSCSVWSPWLVGDIAKIESVQKKAVGMISGLQARTYEDKLIELDLWSLEKRRLLFDYVQMYKIANGIGNVKTSMKMYGEQNTIQRTRNQTEPLNLIRSRSNLDIRKNFYTVRIAEQWNNIPSVIKHLPNVKQFKQKVTEWMR